MKNGRKAEPEQRKAYASGKDGGTRVAETERIKIEREQQAVNPYYLKVSKGYKAAKFCTLALFLGYLILMMCMYRSSITYDNLMYLVRDFETDVDVSSRGFEGISYSESDRMSFAFYKDRFAIATGSDFTMYNTTGAVELEYDHSMENPKVETGEKYALVYDIGGTSYSIYNTIARVSVKNTDYVLQGADISDSGAFALITRSNENRYLVSFYDSSFRELTRVYKDKYVTDVALDGTGKKYALVSCDVTNSDFTLEVMSGSVSSDTSQNFTLDGLFPLSVDWFDDGSFAVVCDSATIFVNADGVMTSKYEYGDMSLISADINGNRLFLAGGENTVGSTSRGVILDSTGSIADSFSYLGKISCAVLSDNFAFYSSGEELVKRDMSGNTVSSPCPAYTTALVPCFDNVAVCTGTEVKMGFESSEETAEDGKGENDKKETDGKDTVNVEMGNIEG